MRHRIYTPSIDAEVRIEGDEFHHAVRVARVREGEEVELFDGRGRLASGRIATIDHNGVTVKVEREIPDRESPMTIHLAMAIIQLEKFELVLQKATELGVRSIIPLITERVEIRPERYRGKTDRWEKILFEAVKQSGRARVPELRAAATFEEVLTLSGVRVLFDADADPSPLPPSLTDVTILIGPEGGWTEAEVQMARDSGAIVQRLGPRRLRAETAAIAATAIFAARYGDI